MGLEIPLLIGFILIVIILIGIQRPEVGRRWRPRRRTRPGADIGAIGAGLYASAEDGPAWDGPGFADGGDGGDGGAD